MELVERVAALGPSFAARAAGLLGIAIPVDHGGFGADFVRRALEPGSIAHWPGGLVLAFPASGSVNGTVVLAPYLAAFDEPDAYAVSHVGWGMDPGARWEALATRCGRCRSGLRSGSRTRREEPSCSR